jgi:uncharacterized protein
MDFNIIFISLAGLAGGFIGAQVGAGALITLPALMFIGLEPTLAIGTNILSGWIINIVAVFKYWKNCKINFRLVVPLSIISLIGAFIGANLVLNIKKELLSKIVAVFFLGLVFLIFKKPTAGLEMENKKLEKKNFIIAGILCFVLGVYGGFFSVGVTTFLIFLFVLLLGRNLIQGIADALFVTSVMLVAALIVFVKKNNIDFSLAIPLAIASIIGSYIGAHAALKYGVKWIRGLLIVAVIALIIKLLFNL